MRKHEILENEKHHEKRRKVLQKEQRQELNKKRREATAHARHQDLVRQAHKQQLEERKEVIVAERHLHEQKQRSFEKSQRKEQRIRLETEALKRHERAINVRRITRQQEYEQSQTLCKIQEDNARSARLLQEK